MVDGQKIYARYGETDMLLYDFGLEVGDFIPMYEAPGFIYQYDKVQAIDYVTLPNGRNAKRLHYEERSADIEFVGCEFGILSPIIMPFLTTCGGTFSCCSLNGEPIYETSPGICASLNLETALPVVKNSNFNFDITGNYMRIQTSNELIEVKFYILNGQCVMQSSQTDIDVSALPQGMYIIRALTADGQQHQAKFIKQ